MSWKRHFKTVKNNQNIPQISTDNNANNASSVTSSQFRSYLPMVYAGHAQRIARYFQFSEMNTDSDINAALDTIADFSTQSEEHADQPFELKYNGEPNETEVKILKTMMTKWIKLNNFKARLWNMFRDTLQNGDAFFLRDPETHEWLWLDHFMVEMVKPNQEDGKTPEEYFVRNLDYNKQMKFATKQADPNGYRTPYGTSTVGASRTAPVSSSSSPASFSLAGNAMDPRQRNHMQSQEVSVIDAKHVVHLSLSTGNDINWPFGSSILEPIFKVYKQKELLEDAIIIYRVQRAPERRIFYIDVGTMSPNRAKAHLEAVKNDIHQRRIPNRGANGQNMMDSAYNPLSLQDDFYFANSSDGRGSKVETLPGGDALGEVGDLMIFSRKLARGLRVPTSYLNLGDDEGGGNVSFNDGKLGAAMIQEFRFSKYCMRWQSLLAPTFDKEFKRFCVSNGIEMDWSLFELQFCPPQSFTKYRQIELDAQRVQVYSGVSENKKLSERFKLLRFLGLTEDEMVDNERMWSEENADKIKKKTGNSAAVQQQMDGLSSVGIRPMGDDMGGMGVDMNGLPEEPMPDMGGQPPPPPPSGGTPQAGGSPTGDGGMPA